MWGREKKKGGDYQLLLISDRKKINKKTNKNKTKQTKRNEKKNKFVKVSNVKYLCLRARSILSRSLKVKVKLIGLHNLPNVLFTELPKLTQDPKTNNSKMLTWPPKNRSFERSARKAYKLF